MRNTFAVLVLWLLTSTVHAQLNIELDDYARDRHKMPSLVEPAFDDGDCVYVPARFNMSAGDIVLSADPDGVIYKLLSSLGQQHSHSGMASSENSFRHNTAEADAIKTVDSGLIPQRLRASGDYSLRDAWPGMIDQTVEAASLTREFLVPGGLVLTAAEDEPWELAQARAQQRRRALDLLTRFQGYYSFFAYTDIGWGEPFTKSYGNGNMCSGSIYHAQRLANNNAWTPDSLRYYASEVRQPAAEVLYDELRRTIRDKPNWIGKIVFAINSLVGSSLDDFARRTANQIVNCMAFNDCGNTDTRWRNGVGGGTSLSPDDMLTLTYLNLFLSSWGGSDTMFDYNAVRPLEESGSYYCCKGHYNGNFLLDGYDTLTCSGG